MELSDLEWGDVVSDDDGVLVVRAVLAGDPVVVKRYAEPRMAREAEQLDEPLGHLAALVLASRADATPAWAQDSLDWLRGRP